MRVLLTGATGFVGSYLLESLLARGDAVRVLVRPLQGQTRSEMIQRLLHSQGVEIIAGSLMDAEALAEAVRGVDVVYHLAWQSNRPTRRTDRRNTNRELHQININGTEQLLRASVASGVQRFIYTGTVLVYDQSRFIGRRPLREDDFRIPPYDLRIHHHGVGGEPPEDYIEPKITVESMIRQFSHQYGLTYVILRPPVVYGVGAWFAENWVRRALYTPWPYVGHNDFMKAQMVHVRDLVDALLLVEAQPTAANEVFNIAGDEVATVAQIKALMRAAVRRLMVGPMLRSPMAARNQRWAPALRAYTGPIYDLTKAKKVLNYTPWVTLREGLEEMASTALDNLKATGSWGYLPQEHWDPGYTRR
jgi:UDP-glucose 4-epimerase